MDHIPLISIIIPTYNRPNWLKQAIVSALGPTRIPVEVVVVDDGSTNTILDIYGYCFIWKSGYVKIERGGLVCESNGVYAMQLVKPFKDSWLEPQDAASCGTIIG